MNVLVEVFCMIGIDSKRISASNLPRYHLEASLLSVTWSAGVLQIQLESNLKYTFTMI
jgi:hypothetical protein